MEVLTTMALLTFWYFSFLSFSYLITTYIASRENINKLSLKRAECLRSQLKEHINSGVRRTESNYEQVLRQVCKFQSLSLPTRNRKSIYLGASF